MSREKTVELDSGIVRCFSESKWDVGASVVTRDG